MGFSFRQRYVDSMSATRQEIRRKAPSRKDRFRTPTQSVTFGTICGIGALFFKRANPAEFDQKRSATLTGLF
jgi:hypothetical protein